MGKLLEIALEIFSLYLLYKLIFDFIIPVYQSTKKVRSHIQDMQQWMEDYQRSQQPPAAPPPPRPAENRKDRDAGAGGEYIDYEEVK